MEHELSAIYDITHGLGLAILTPRWLTYCLDETTVSKYVQFGVEVFGIDAGLPPMNIAKQAIDEPVSYTHLDVYKRQCAPCSKTTPPRPGRTAPWRFAGSIGGSITCLLYTSTQKTTMSTIHPLDVPLVFDDVIVEKLVREFVDKPKGNVYPRDFSDFIDTPKNFVVEYNESTDVYKRQAVR